MTQPGIIFGLNDSGHEPLLFAFDSTGRSRGVWRVNGARNLDWEAAASGPCEAGSDRRCLYIGDVGDNEARKPASGAARRSAGAEGTMGSATR